MLHKKKKVDLADAALIVCDTTCHGSVMVQPSHFFGVFIFLCAWMWRELGSCSCVIKLSGLEATSGHGEAVVQSSTPIRELEKKVTEIILKARRGPASWLQEKIGCPDEDTDSRTAWSFAAGTHTHITRRGCSYPGLRLGKMDMDRTPGTSSQHAAGSPESLAPGKRRRRLRTRSKYEGFCTACTSPLPRQANNQACIRRRKHDQGPHNRGAPFASLKPGVVEERQRRPST